MTIARVGGAVLVGIEARLVEVQVDLSRRGLPGTQTVGLPGTAVRESQERIRSAIRNSGLGGEPARITVNLAPADLPKQGASLDLAVAAAILLAEKGREGREGWLVAGELALDGAVRPIAGALPIALAARGAGAAGLLVPSANALEAAVIGGIDVRGVETLAEALEFLVGERDLPRVGAAPFAPEDPSSSGEDLSDVRGQTAARRALEVAAAGGHNLVLIGPPGTGKTMLARRLRTILPPLTRGEAIEITRVASASGILPPGSGLSRARPFRAPHHSITQAGLIGGGGQLRPGEVSLASEGVLFLDELPEFDRRLLDQLRQPIEEGQLTIVRNRHRFTLPSRFILVAGMNPCPCGYRGSEGGRVCRCTPVEVHRYMARISGPLWDRFDLVVEVPALKLAELKDGPSGEASFTVRARVKAARDRQCVRWQGGGVSHDVRVLGESAASRRALDAGQGTNDGRPICNARLGVRELPPLSSLPADALELLRAAVARLALSARGVHRVLRVARSIADLGGAELLEAAHVAEALSYRPRLE